MLYVSKYISKAEYADECFLSDDKELMIWFDIPVEAIKEIFPEAEEAEISLRFNFECGDVLKHVETLVWAVRDGSNYDFDVIELSESEIETLLSNYYHNGGEDIYAQQGKQASFYQNLLNGLPKSKDGDPVAWTDGEYIMCKSKEVCCMFVNMINRIYANEIADLYYCDPNSDRKYKEFDERLGYYCVRV